ncbi:hypothetical protein MNV49_003339 [Pseudohyphozyma bogoriensis]|nr:hypothetical protein MNV49_003339 [Pseudohyphozyma bogoriensis]
MKVPSPTFGSPAAPSPTSSPLSFSSERSPSSPDGAEQPKSSISANGGGRRNTMIEEEASSTFVAAQSDMLFQSYTSTEFADTNLVVHYPAQCSTSATTSRHHQPATFQLHAIIISLSPLLRHLLALPPSSSSTTTPPSTHTHQLALTIPPTSTSTTHHAFSLTLALLYSPKYLAFLTPDLVKGVLESASLLEMEYAVTYAKQRAEDEIKKVQVREVDKVKEWFAFLTSRAVDGKRGHDGRASPLLPATKTYLLTVLTTHITTTLAAPVLPLLTGKATLPTSTTTNGIDGSTSDSASSSTTTNAATTLKQFVALLVGLDFDDLKTVIESSELSLADLDRYNLAKKCLFERRKRKSTTKLSRNGEGAGGEEEIVGMSFGIEEKGKVRIVLDVKRPRKSVWKVHE